MFDFEIENLKRYCGHMGKKEKLLRYLNEAKTMNFSEDDCWDLDQTKLLIFE